MTKTFYSDDFPPFTLEATLRKSADALCLLLYNLEKNFDFLQHMQTIRSAILKDEIPFDLLSQEANTCDAEYKITSPYKIYFRHACIFHELASISIDRGRTEEGWSFVSQANHLIGLTQAGIFNYFGVDESEVLKANAKKGADKVFKKQEQDRKEIIQLILSKCPIGGWDDENHALNTIIAPFKEILFANLKSPSRTRFKLTPENCERRIKDWLKFNKNKDKKNQSQGEVRLAYEETSHFRRSNPNNY